MPERVGLLRVRCRPSGCHLSRRCGCLLRAAAGTQPLFPGAARVPRQAVSAIQRLKSR